MRLPGVHGEDLCIGEGRTRVMGIVNVTPDSFSDGGAYVDPGVAVAHGLSLVADGADVLDVGGESTRPGYAPVPPDEQIARIIPVIAGLRARTGTPISVDTTQAPVAAAAVEAGADWINDTSAGAEDPEILDVAARHGCPLVLMHRFTPPREDGAPSGRALTDRILSHLTTAARRAEARGVDHDRIILDPGLGFGTLYEDNVVLMADTSPLASAPYPWLFGPSRKSFIGQMTGKPPAERLFGTAAAVAILAVQGVAVIRVHDVAAMVDVVKVADALRAHRVE